MKRLFLLCITCGGVIGGAMLGAPLLKQPGRAPGLLLTLGAETTSYSTQIAGAAPEETIRIDLRPEVRKVALRFHALPPVEPGENRLMAIELVELSAGAARPKLLGSGFLTQVRDPERMAEVYRVLWILPEVTMPRKEEVTWEVRVKSLPLGPKAVGRPVQVGMRIHSDARPLTEQEKRLMAWRDSIKDPIAQVEQVRAKMAELTDEEVRHYTAFDSRESFLKYWMKLRPGALRDERGRVPLEHRAGYRGLTNRGEPLPNGKHLHHNGSLPE